MLGLVGGRKSLVPQQLLLADACNASTSTVSVLLPRRSTKTTSLFALALGRCASRPEYLVGYTACTSGQKARDRFFKDIVAPLERLFPDVATRGFKIRKAGGTEKIMFDNGSIFQVLPPQGESFRSDAFDLVILDEAGEASPEMGDDLLAGVLPTFDTRPDAQLIIAGTAAKYREGNLLWDALVDGRAGRASTGIVEYAAPDSTTAEDLDDWERVAQLVKAAHPGVGTLTTMELVRTRWEKLKRHQFAEEYLSIFGMAGVAVSVLNMDQWAAAADPRKLPARPPAHHVIAIALHPNQTCASLVAVWRAGGKAHLMLVEHARGVQWVAGAAAKHAKRYRVPIVHDSMGPVLVEVEELARLRPRPKLLPQTYQNCQTAAALLVKEVEVGNVVHYDQDEMNEAAQIVTKRAGTRGGWLLGRKLFEQDITPLEAAAMALRVYDATPAKTELVSIFAA